ncbi:MAG TPA: TRAP transporter substrate-binding protein DctP [Deltaproteobacteria bacterium]|nr:TRAP transporter substrate-binding protein DctP [Deltaproteobacteria bacterium]HPR56387.1 TRAP transporter substrate-binding protein DctP [Deltaproteobacteria bacterium]
MKKKVLMIAVLALVVFMSGSFPCEAAQKVYKWKLQAWRSAAEPGMAYYVEMFNKTLPAMTDGRLQIKMYWGGELVATPDLLDSVKMGVVDMGLASAYTYQGVIPCAAVEYGLPFGIRTPNELYNFMYGKKLPNIFGGWRAIDVLRPEYQKQGVYLLTTGVDCWPGAFMFKSPINKLSDIKGKKVRASGLMMDWIEKFGGNGVFIPGEETYTSLQTGALDGVSWGSAIAMYSVKFHEVAKNFLWPPIDPINCANVIVNEKSWKSLPPDLQVALEQAMIIAGMNHTYHQNWTGEQWGLTQMKKAGVKINELKGEELEKATKAAHELWDKEAKRSPASAKLVNMTKDYMRAMGYLD